MCSRSWKEERIGEERGDERGARRKGTGKMLGRETRVKQREWRSTVSVAHMILTVWVGVKLAIPKE